MSSVEIAFISPPIPGAFASAARKGLNGLEDCGTGIERTVVGRPSKKKVVFISNSASEADMMLKGDETRGVLELWRESLAV